MNLTTPIIISDNNEDFRGLLREMLTKHGFFHILEATSPSETINLLRTTKNCFSIVQASLLDEEVYRELSQEGKFLVLSSGEKEKTVKLATFLGVDRLMGLPFSSQTLVEKIRLLAQ